MELKNGDKIKFKAAVYSEPSEDSPRQLLARKGEICTFINYTEWHFECEVQDSLGQRFSCHKEEFEVISENKKGDNE